MEKYICFSSYDLDHYLLSKDEYKQCCDIDSMLFIFLMHDTCLKWDFLGQYFYHYAPLVTEMYGINLSKKAIFALMSEIFNFFLNACFYG